MKTFGANELPDMSAAYSEIQEKSKKRWQDDDGDGKWYEKSDVDGKISKREKEEKKKNSKKHDCASKVKHEEYGIGQCIKGMHDLDESGKVAHYDVLFEHGIEKHVDVSSLEILVTEMHEHVIHEGKKNCGCGQDPCITYGKGKNAHEMPDGTVMPGKTHKEEVQAEGNQRDPDQQKKDRHHSKQPDPSKDGFTGIGNMSIDDIMKMNKKIKAKSKKEEVENDAQEITEISADLALKASKKAEVERGKAAVAGNREKAVAKLKQSSRLYAKQAAKRRKENAGG
jgi:hypothetical protein